MSDIMMGTCEICGKKDMYLTRTIYSYPHIKCECHQPNHFIIIDHCNICTPEEPGAIRLHISTAELHRLGMCSEIAERMTNQR